MAGSGIAAGEGPQYGDATVHAKVPTPPGFPEGIAVVGNRMVVAGPATFGTTGKGPSQVLLYNKTTGALVTTYHIKGENLLAEHANSTVAIDGKGRMYVLNTQLGIVRLTFDGTQSSYSKPFPDLHICLVAPAGTPCSPTPVDTPSLPNDIAFDEAGNAYVTDSMQATIWRVPSGGGLPQIWLQDERLASAYIGVNGLRLDPSRKYVYFTVSADLLGQGWVYRLPVGSPTLGDLEVVHHYALGEAPDGIAFGENGHLYVALAVPYQSGISVLRADDGTEEARFSNPRAQPHLALRLARQHRLRRRGLHPRHQPRLRHRRAVARAVQRAEGLGEGRWVAVGQAAAAVTGRPVGPVRGRLTRPPGAGAPLSSASTVEGRRRALQQPIELILMKQLAGYLTLPIFLVDGGGTLLYYNEPAEAILGVRYEETGEMALEEWGSDFSPTDEAGRPLVPEDLPLAQALRRRAPVAGGFVMRGFDGVRRSIEVFAFPLDGRGDRPAGAVAVFWERADP